MNEMNISGGKGNIPIDFVVLNSFDEIGLFASFLSRIQ